MVRKVHEEGLRERQNMKEASESRKDGNWCVVGLDSTEGYESGLQAWRLESKDDAEKEKEKLDNNSEFDHFTHRVMTHTEYEEWCEEQGIERSFPWQ